MSLKKVVACIKKHKYFLITTHTSPEGDAVGSELAFARLLKKLGKIVTIVNEDDVPYEYGFLPGVSSIKKFSRNITGLRFDCLVFLDCSEAKRAGEVSRISTGKKIILNIDHHISNRKFGQLNWVEPYSSSASEMIYKLYKKMRIPLDRESAVSLYTGILTDTGSFRYSNTTSSTHQAVSELIKYGLDIPRIYKNIYENIPFGEIKLLNKVLSRMQREAKGKIIWFQIAQKILKNKALSFDLAEQVLSFARSVKDAEAVVLFRENPGVKGEIRVNFRSQGKVDVNKIASYFGGGGHKTASGCTIRGKISQVRKKVLSRIRENLEQ